MLLSLKKGFLYVYVTCIPYTWHVVATQCTCVDWSLTGPWERSFPLVTENIHRESKGLAGVPALWEENQVCRRCFPSVMAVAFNFSQRKGRETRKTTCARKRVWEDTPFWRHLWVEIWRLLRQAGLECPKAIIFPSSLLPPAVIYGSLLWSHKLIFTLKGGEGERSIGCFHVHEDRYVVSRSPVGAGILRAAAIFPERIPGLGATSPLLADSEQAGSHPQRREAPRVHECDCQTCLMTTAWAISDALSSRSS